MANTPVPPPPGRPPSRLKTVLKVLGVLSLLGVLIFLGYALKKNKSTTTSAKSPASSASSETGGAPAPTVVAKNDAVPDDCPDGSLWDTKKKVCVERAVPAPVTFPSSIAVTLPCPSNCAPVASASAPASAAPLASTAHPAPTNTNKGHAPVTVVPVRLDISAIGDPAKFPSGN